MKLLTKAEVWEMPKDRLKKELLNPQHLEAPAVKEIPIRMIYIYT